jgi:pimeloyl-ACP methyl ester carboxylesterase
VTPLVLLHAFPLESGMYAGVGHHLSGGVVTLDLPGFGGTPVPTGEPSMDVYADAVAFELDRLGHERVILGGTSMGGYAAMAFCRRHRDRVAGLALIDTKAAADVPDAAAGRRAMAERMLDSDSTDALVESVLPKLLGETTKATRPEVVTQVEGWVRDAPVSAAAYAQRAMAARPESFDTLRATTVPSVVVVGEEDVLAPVSDAEAMVAALPDAGLVVIGGVGHLTPVEAPQAVAQALDALVSRVVG